LLFRAGGGFQANQLTGVRLEKQPVNGNSSTVNSTVVVVKVEIALAKSFS